MNSVISITLGTAGHIDHGKTSIVKCLTGCWCDTLPEEQARGMTIDVGFAVWERSGKQRVGIVDVPGHERFIHNMVAGASGIDVVMLVVAADDGVMPQTIEHLHIVRMLGIRRGIVVMNKIDLADDDKRTFVEEEIREAVLGSFLENAPIVRFSTKTGEGLDDLFDALGAAVDASSERDGAGPFLLHIERSFVLQGLGTILSGIPRSGTVRLGDEVELLPEGTRHTVKGIQVYGNGATEGRAGECVALRLSNVTTDILKRGNVVATPGYFHPSRFLNVKFFYLPSHKRPLELRTAIRFHVGTSDTPGHLVLPTQERLSPGAETYAQIQLGEPVVTAPGDFFVIRQRSPVLTLGGGTVIDVAETKMRRGRGNWLEHRTEKEQAISDDTLALLLVLKDEKTPMHIDNIARAANVTRDIATEKMAELAQHGKAIAFTGDRYLSAEALHAVTDDLMARFTELHAAHPLYRGFEKREVLKSFTAPRNVVDAIFEQLLKDGTLTHESDRFFLKEKEPKLSAAEQRLADQLTQIFEQARFATPRPDELPAQLRLNPAFIDEVLMHLRHTGTLIELADQILIHATWLAESRRILEDHLRKHGRIRLADYKDLLDTSRKFAVPLLEHWDRAALTRRCGDERVLRVLTP